MRKLEELKWTDRWFSCFIWIKKTYPLQFFGFIRVRGFWSFLNVFLRFLQKSFKAKTLWESFSEKKNSLKNHVFSKRRQQAGWGVRDVVFFVVWKKFLKGFCFERLFKKTWFFHHFDPLLTEWDFCPLFWGESLFSFHMFYS